MAEIDVANMNWTDAGRAQKTGRVAAVFVPEGTALTTVMDGGEVETTKIAGPGGAMRVTNATGEEYLLEIPNFEARYRPAGQGAYAPVDDPVPFLISDVDGHFLAPWGTPMALARGDAICNRGGGDIYRIRAREFAETFAVLVAPRRLARVAA